MEVFETGAEANSYDNDAVNEATARVENKRFM